MFEKLVTDTAQRLHLPTETVSSVLSSLIGYMTNERSGGISGFVESFRRAGVRDVISSWYGGKEGRTVTPSHIEAALGPVALQKIADSSGVTRDVATSIVAALLPKVIGFLTPNGTLPSNESVRTTSSTYLNRPAPVPQRAAEPRSSTRWLPWAAVAALALLTVVVVRNRAGPAAGSGIVTDTSTRVVREAAGSVAPPSSTATMAADLVGVTWQWVELTTPGELRTMDNPERYTVRFDSAGRVALRADCNRGTGTYSVSANQHLKVNPLALTRAMCPPGSLSDRFAAQVGRATRYEVRDGSLYLELPGDSGTLRFRRASN
jgi:uncharacterized protein YidB (DUF937 family)/heat shock protein HslJ